MPASLHDWVNRLKRQPLPAIAFTVQCVSALMEKPSSSNTDYRHIVARDPGFALSIFRHLGNLPRPPQEPIVTLSHALAMAGTAPLEVGTKTLTVINATAASDHHRGLLACYSRAAHAAIYLCHWGEIRKDSNPEELMLAALLHDCGEMALWWAAPDQMAEFESQTAQGMSRENASIKIFRFTLSQLSLELAKSWALPPLMCDALSPDGAFRPRPLGVMLACELAQCSAATWDSGQTMDLIELAAEYCRQSVDQAAAALHTLSAEAARRLQGLNLPLSATELLQLQPVQREAAPPATPSTQSQPAMIKQTRDDEQLMIEPDTEENSEPSPMQPQTDASSQILLSGIMKQLRDNAGLERSMFAMLSPDRNSLRARFIMGAEKNAGIRTFQVNLDKRHLFSVVMSKPQSFWLNPGNRKKYLPAIPAYLHNTLNIQGFFICSLFANERPLGILYADSSSGRNLNNGSFTYFKQLAQQLSTELASAGKVSAIG